MSEAKIISNLDGLNKFVKGMQLFQSHIVKVGIMGKDAKRKEKDGTTNAEVGAAHELGSPSRNVPARSFLRMPLFVKTRDIIDDVKTNSSTAIAKGDIWMVLSNIGVSCEGIIADAFATRGFGFWKALKTKTIKYKIQQNPDPLINTRQLERSVTSKVEKLK